MRRRRTLINDYLRAHDPLRPDGPVTPAPDRVRDRASRGLRPRRSWPALAGSSLALAGAAAAIVLVVGSPAGDQAGPLSAEDAIAGVAADLSTNGILEWRTRSHFNGDRYVTSVQWTDLQTAEQHTVAEDGAYRARGKLVDKIFYSWRTKTADWSAREDRNTKRRIRVKEYEAGFLGTRAFGTTDSPVGQLREALELAKQGKATLEHLSPRNGVPVVRVTVPLRRDPVTAATYSLGISIAQGASPRVLRTQLTESCPGGDAACDPNGDTPAGRTRLTPMTASETVHWEVHRRTPEAIAQVALPTDTTRYELIPR